MRINKITLNNFGSYEDMVVFEIPNEKQGNVVVIGGKNGAGKTTLFKAIRICLYGYISMGYTSYNTYYKRAIIDLINRNAKQNRIAQSSIDVSIDMINNYGVDEYSIKRSWILDKTLTEELVITKNGIELNESERNDFEKYLIDYIPPDIFNLFFFDGEHIADFFLNENGNKELKKAFLTVCKLDTFDIMYNLFSNLAKKSTDLELPVNEYIEMKNKIESEKDEIISVTNSLNQCIMELENCEAEINKLDSEFVKAGGITISELNNLNNIIKEEEARRDGLNKWIKNIATNKVPFIIIEKELIKLKDQIYKEENNSKYIHFNEVLKAVNKVDLDCKESLIDETAIKILKYNASCMFSNDINCILGLSIEDRTNVLSLVNNMLKFNKNEIIEKKYELLESISSSKKARTKLGDSNIDLIQNYNETKSNLVDKKNTISHERIHLEQELLKLKENNQNTEKEYNRIRTNLEKDLKNQSINDVSSKAMLMLENLISELYKKQFLKAEKILHSTLNNLMRKKKFVTDVIIDEDFNISLFRNETIGSKNLIEILENDTFNRAEFMKSPAYQKLKVIYETNTLRGVLAGLKKDVETIVLPIEMSVNQFSSGEKQIFIMALYYTLVQLSDLRIPFIIDTPFARIDAAHRNNIIENLINKLEGQVFILSTDQELNQNHIELLGSRVATTFMLEHVNNKQTVVYVNQYFERYNNV
ncbi:MAG TPA: AAA family ATPase [Anaerovoracaceae bacterium]|nr:AAA family ATPase [Anaerovoracaceae bacterium]